MKIIISNHTENISYIPLVIKVLQENISKFNLNENIEINIYKNEKLIIDIEQFIYNAKSDFNTYNNLTLKFN